MTKQKKTTAKKAITLRAQKSLAPTKTKPNSKLGQLEAMLRRPDGATIEQISKSLHWQAHSVRGAMSGALKKKQGLTIASDKAGDGRRVYRIAT